MRFFLVKVAVCRSRPYSLSEHYHLGCKMHFFCPQGNIEFECWCSVVALTMIWHMVGVVHCLSYLWYKSNIATPPLQLWLHNSITPYLRYNVLSEKIGIIWIMAPFYSKTELREAWGGDGRGGWWSGKGGGWKSTPFHP